MLKENLDVVPGGKLHNQALGVIGVAEIGCPPDTRGYTHGKLTDFQSVEAKMTLTGVAHRRPMPFSVPILEVLGARLMLVR